MLPENDAREKQKHRRRQAVDDERRVGHDVHVGRAQESRVEQQTFAALSRLRTVSERLERPMAATALAWLLHQPQVASVLAGARTPEQVRKNCEAAALRLDGETVQELSAVTESLKQLLGANPDMWQSDSRIR